MHACVEGVQNKKRATAANEVKGEEMTRGIVCASVRVKAVKGVKGMKE